MEEKFEGQSFEDFLQLWEEAVKVQDVSKQNQMLAWVEYAFPDFFDSLEFARNEIYQLESDYNVRLSFEEVTAKFVNSLSKNPTSLTGAMVFSNENVLKSLGDTVNIVLGSDPVWRNSLKKIAKPGLYNQVVKKAEKKYSGLKDRCERLSNLKLKLSVENGKFLEKMLGSYNLRILFYIDNRFDETNLGYRIGFETKSLR